MNPRSTPVLVVVVCAGVIAGFIAGRLSISRDLASEHASIAALPDAGQTERALGHAGLSRADEIPDSPLTQFRAKLQEVASAREVWRSEQEWTWRMRADPDWQRIIGSLSTDQIPAALADVQRTTDPALRRALVGLIVARWGQLDPRAALAWVDGSVQDTERRTAVLGVIRGWALADARAAGEWARQLPEGTLRAETAAAVIEQLARIDLPAAFELLVSNRFSRGHVYGVAPLSAVFETWADRDPAGAIANVARLRSENERSFALQTIAKVWGARDGPSAFAWIQTLPADESRREIIASLASSWAARDPERAAESLSSSLSGSELANAARGLVATWAATDASAALRWIGSLPEPTARIEALNYLGFQWDDLPAEARSALLTVASDFPPGLARNNLLRSILGNGVLHSDPMLALDFVQKLPSGGEKAQLIGQVLGHIAATNPEDALAKLQQLPRDVDVSSVVQSMISWGGGMRLSPEMAAAFIVAMPAGEAQASAAWDIGHDYARQNAPAAMQWVDGLPAGPMKSRALTAVLKTTAETDPQAALAWADGFEPTMRDEAMQTIAHTLALKDPSGALELALERLSGAAQSRALAGIGFLWASANPATSTEVLARIPEGPGRDAFAQSFIGGLAQSSPREAASLAAQLPAGDAHDNTIKTVLNQWLRNDPAAAATWVAGFPAGVLRDDAVQDVARAWLQFDRRAAETWLSEIAVPPERIRHLLDGGD